MLHAEISAMDYTMDIVSKCRFFFIFKHLRARVGFKGGPGPRPPTNKGPPTKPFIRPPVTVVREDLQEAQLLLGDRATRKHAKDS